MSKPVIDKKAVINRDEYQRWATDEFKRMVLGKEPEWVTQQLTDLYSKDNFRESYMSSIDKIRRLKNLTFIDPTNYICTIFRVFSAKDNLAANYAFMYSVDAKYHDQISTDDSKHASPVIKLFGCASPSLVSQDGEYRTRLLPVSQLKLIINKNAKIFEVIERFMVDKIEREELSLEFENFHPQLELEKAGEDLDQQIVTQGLLMKYFMQFWLVEVYSISVGLQENHMNPKFNRIFFKDLKSDLKSFNLLIKQFGEPAIKNLVRYLSDPVSNVVIDGKLEMHIANNAVGQKLRPLNVSEVQDPLNIKYNPWREVFLSARSSDLVANFICPSLPIFLDWFYIKNAKKGLFDNEQQYQRLEYSERALIIVRKLRETQRLTYMQDWFKNKDSKKFLNELFEILDDKIEDPIEYAKSNLMMSNVTLGFVNENVGRTIYDVPVLSKSAVWVTRVGDILKDTVAFRKYVWDICYALLCLNIKCGIVHSDLHLNNITIDTNDSAVIKRANPHNLYKLLNYWFMFPTRGPYACIIDFSRGVILPSEAKSYDYFKKNPDQFGEFIEDQNGRIMAKLYSMFPTFMKINSDKVLKLIQEDFDKFYKIYTAVDTYDFSSKLLRHFTDHKAAKANLDLLAQISKLSEHYLTNILLKVINNPDTQIEWPIFHILKECFVDNIIDPHKEQKDVTIVDFWSLDREMTYSFSNMDRFPPIVRTAYGVRDDGSKYKLPIADSIEAHRQKYETYRKKSMSMVHYIAQRHQEKYK